MDPDRIFRHLLKIADDLASYTPAKQCRMTSRKRKEAPFPTAHIDVPARDQRLLKATLVTPKHSEPTDPVVLIAPATAVPRIFYVPYMWFLVG